MIQLYANIYDLIPTEGTWVNAVSYDELVDKSEWDLYQHHQDKKRWSYKLWLKDIQQNGIKYQLNVHPTGHIADGNFRYQCARKLCGMGQSLITRFQYIPINPFFFLGVSKPAENQVTVRHPLIAPTKLFTKERVRQSKTVLPPIDDSILGHGDNRYANIYTLEYKR